MKDHLLSIHETLISIEDEFGGDIAFIPPATVENLRAFESSIGWKLPEVFFYLYAQETNGLIVDNKKIYGIFDKEQKKSWVDNLTRMNDPKTSPWFIDRPHIFLDYLVIGNDGGMIFCLSKKYNTPNPALYICKNPNNKNGVDLDNLGLDLESLILEMVKQTFQE